MALTEFRVPITTMINDQYGDEFLEGSPDLRHQIQEQIKRRLIRRMGAANSPSVEFEGDTVMTVTVLVPTNLAARAQARIDAIEEFEFTIAGKRVSVEVEGVDRVFERDAPAAGPAAAGAGGPAGGKRRKTRKVKKSRRKTRRWFF
jgi:hypothetical protein